MMHKRTTLVLSVIAASLLAFILIFERGTLSTSDVARRSGHVLTRFVRDRVTQVELVRGDEAPIVFEREPPPPDDEEATGIWRIAGPVRAAADQDAVDSFLGALEWLMAERTLTGVTSEDRARYGLAQPRFVVRYRVADEEGQLEVGGEAPEGQGIYVAADDAERAFVVRRDIVESIDHDLAHFRDKDLFPPDFYGRDARSVRLEGAAQPIAFEKEGDRWLVREPVRGWASAGAVDRLLGLPRALHAARFVSEDASELARYGLDAPWRELTITRPDDARGTRRARLRVGAVCGEHTSERYAIVGEDGPIVCALASELSPLELDPANVREARLVGVGADAMERIVLESGGRTLTLSRADAGWELAVGEGAPSAADDTAISEWVQQLRESRALAFEPIAGDALGHGLAAPAATLTIARSDADEDVVVRLGEVGADGAWVRRDDEAALVRFDARVAELLRAGPLRFRSRALVNAEAADAREVAVRRAEGEERATRGEGGSWEMQGPVHVEADRVLVRELARRIAELRATRFVAETAAPEHGLASPRLTISARFQPDGSDEGQTVSLRVGAATADGAYAQLDGGPVVELSRETLDALDVHLASLDLPSIETNGVATLRIERDGALVTELTREGSGWQAADGTAPDAERTRALLDRLSALRASGVVAYGAPDAALGLSPPALRVSAIGQDGTTSTVELGREQGSGEAAFVPLRRSGVDVTYRVAPDLVAPLRTYAP